MENLNKAQETALQLFTEYLEKHKLRKTPERITLLNVIFSIDKPFDMETLMTKMEESNYPVSRATLYNNITHLTQCKLVTKLHTKEGRTMYEKSLNTTAHNLFVCTNCGKTKRFSDNTITRAIQYKKTKYFTPTHYTLYIYGICSECTKKGIKI